MIILTIRTDKPEAEIGLFNDDQKVAYRVWQADRELSNTIHQVIEQILQDNHQQWADITAIVTYQGPGSFTGLRIGLSVANALAYSLSIPIANAQGDNWIQQGIARIRAGEQDQVALPEYGRGANITTPRK